MKANDTEYLKSFCSKCKKQYDIGFVDTYFPYESENNKCMDCFKHEYLENKTELAELRERCDSAEKALYKFEEIASNEIKILKDALEFECGDKCHPEHNPCNAREVLNKLNMAKYKGDK